MNNEPIAMEKFIYPKDKPNYDEKVILSWSGELWTVYYYNDEHGEDFTTVPNGNQLFIPEDTGATFTWYRIDNEPKDV